MYQGNSLVALIGARGGSKGLPGKNIRSCGGKPLIQWTIDAALACGYIDEVVVSTDDEAIREVAIDCGASAPFLRPADLATDTASSESFLAHAIDELATMGKHFDYLLNLQPTTPLRTARHLKEAIEEYFERRQSPHETLISVYEVPSKMQWLMSIDNGLLEFCFDNKVGGLRRQDAPSYYLPNGAIYIYPADLIREGVFSKPTHPYVMPAVSSIDIDNLEEFEEAARRLLETSGES